MKGNDNRETSKCKIHSLLDSDKCQVENIKQGCLGGDQVKSYLEDDLLIKTQRKVNKLTMHICRGRAIQQREQCKKSEMQTCLACSENNRASMAEQKSG